jgi:hypothetical protein
MCRALSSAIDWYTVGSKQFEERLKRCVQLIDCHQTCRSPSHSYVARLTFNYNSLYYISRPIQRKSSSDLGSINLSNQMCLDCLRECTIKVFEIPLVIWHHHPHATVVNSYACHSYRVLPRNGEELSQTWVWIVDLVPSNSPSTPQTDWEYRNL